MQPTVGHTRRVCRIIREWCKTSDATAEGLWRVVMPHLPKRKKTPEKEGQVLNLSNTKVPQAYTQLLAFGPKHCIEPVLNRAEKLATARTVSREATDDEKARCVAEC
ncbi:hypothetical protein HPB52_009660 [Rhipicephalus sanguineus]|uniref:Uncharacterized protein n=1 Tax=Rhipicephalus sanguineus TaxID=34632 RepID=A0A9D4PXY9_RHISA|nr:hypothetical protein HPB52_009660 [Rhipicephalus sanguineus]